MDLQIKIDMNMKISKITFLMLSVFFAAIFTSCSSEKNVYMFTSFREPADAGLRLLYSHDGYKWTDLDTIFIKPEVSGKVIRDPSIVQGPDGTFHFVWTSSWKGNYGF